MPPPPPPQSPEPPQPAPQPTLHGRGALPSPPDSRDYPFDHALYQPIGAVIPFAVELRGGDAPSRVRPVGPVRDQGPAGSCVGHAATLLREALRVAAGAPFQRYSPLFTWYEARRREGTQNQDTGCFPRDALESLRKDGACPEQLDPYVPGEYADPPLPVQLQTARKFPIAAYHTVTSWDQAQTALASRTPLIATIRAGTAFESTGPDGIVPATALADQATDWNHEVALVGYTPDWITIQNSWGQAWANAGYCYVPVSAFPSFFLDVWTASLR